MRNNIINLTATGGWDTVPDIQSKGVTSVTIQARTTVDVLYRWTGETTYWTIKSGTVRILYGTVHQGELQMQATKGTIIEIEITSKPVLASGV